MISVPALFGALVVLTVTSPIWLPVAVAVDAFRLRRRFPIARLLVFGVCWTWIEAASVMYAFWLWIIGRAGRPESQYGLMAWWSSALMKALAATTGIRPRLEGLEALDGGNAVVLSRHVSLADSLLSGWVTGACLGLWPRYVLKRELLFDPCLDIVGLRVPNHFLDRVASDTDAELEALVALAAGVGPGSSP